MGFEPYFTSVGNLRTIPIDRRRACVATFLDAHPDFPDELIVIVTPWTCELQDQVLLGLL
jgi:hypothetical protein